MLQSDDYRFYADQQRHKIPQKLVGFNWYALIIHAGAGSLYTVVSW